jgi:hypothetical protein
MAPMVSSVLRDDFARRGINVYAALAQDLDSMMSIDHRTIWTNLQSSLLSRSQRIDKRWGRRFRKIAELRRPSELSECNGFRGTIG